MPENAEKARSMKKRKELPAGNGPHNPHALPTPSLASRGERAQGGAPRALLRLPTAAQLSARPHLQKARTALCPVASPYQQIWRPHLSLWALPRSTRRSRFECPGNDIVEALCAREASLPINIGCLQPAAPLSADTKPRDAFPKPSHVGGGSPTADLQRRRISKVGGGSQPSSARVIQGTRS